MSYSIFKDQFYRAGDGLLSRHAPRLLQRARVNYLAHSLERSVIVMDGLDQIIVALWFLPVVLFSSFHCA